MNVKEVDGVFHCDCGFSWSRGKNGNHNCADGLRKKIQQLVADNEKAMDSLRQADAAVKLAHEKYSAIAAENMSIKAMNDCLSEELRGYESDGAFEGPKMHLLWWQVETPATDSIYAGIKADALPDNIAEIIDSGDLETICYESERSYAEDFRLALYNFRQLREGGK